MGYQVGNSQENSTRSLCLIRVLYIQNTYGLYYILMSTLFLTQGHYIVYMCSDVIFQILLLYSRPMTSHHVTCHVTVMSHASSSSLKRNIKLKEKQIKEKEKYQCPKHSITKMFERTISLSTLYSKSITISILSSSKNHLGQLLGLFPDQKTVKVFLWQTFQITQISLPLLENLTQQMTSQSYHIY